MFQIVMINNTHIYIIITLKVIIIFLTTLYLSNTPEVNIKNITAISICAVI